MRFVSYILAAAVVAMAGYGAYVYQERYRPALKEAQDCRARLASLEEDYQHLQAKLEKAEQRLASHEADLAHVQEDYTRRIQELQKAVQEKDQLIQELQSRLSQQIKASARVQQENEKMKEEIERLKTALQAAEAHAYMLEQVGVKKQKALEIQREEQLDALRKKDQRIQELEMRLGALEETRDKLEAALQQCRKDNAELKKAVEEISNKQLAADKAPAKQEAPKTDKPGP